MYRRAPQGLVGFKRSGKEDALMKLDNHTRKAFGKEGAPSSDPGVRYLEHP